MVVGLKDIGMVECLHWRTFMIYWLKELTKRRKYVIINYMSKLVMLKELSGEGVKTRQVLLFSLENMEIVGGRQNDQFRGCTDLFCHWFNLYPSYR